MSEITKEIQTKHKEALKTLFQSFLTGMHNHRATQPRDFLDSIGLDFQKLHLGFNSGQFHHRTDDTFKVPYIELGILVPSDAPVRESWMQGYSCFADYGIIFPLKDEKGFIVNFYGYRIKLQTPKGEFLNDKGIYPAFPPKRTNRLFLTDNVIDSASLVQCQVIENRDSVVSLKDGCLTNDIKKAIREIEELEQIVILTTTKNDSLSSELQKITDATITTIELPEKDSLNEMLLKYGHNGIEKFIQEIEENKIEESEIIGFTQISDNEYSYKGKEVTYKISGLISQNSTLLELDFVIKNDFDDQIIRTRLDLLDSMKTKEELYLLTDNKEWNCNLMLLELEDIKTQLELTRRNQIVTNTKRGFSSKQDKLAKQLLKSETLFEELTNLIGKAGVIGEQKSRLLLYIIASSYKFKYNLHAVVHSMDIGVGSEFVSKIASLIPDIEQYSLDLTTSRTFRYYGNSIIDNKLLVIPDYSGVITSNAIQDLKRLQAKGMIVNDAPTKGKDGVLTTEKKEVLGHTSSIGACSNSKRIFEGEPRTVLVKMDNSSEQIQRQMDYDCLIMSGGVDSKAEQQSIELLQYIVKNLHPLEVVNPFASALMLPTTIRNARMMTLQLHSFVSLITLFSQHKRDKDKEGRVIAQKEDIQIGIDLFLDAIMLSIDDLDVGTRDFFDRLKSLILQQKDKHSSQLSSLDIQRHLSISKSHANRFLKTLVDCEYIKKEGHKNIGLLYSVTNWDELNTVRELIQNKLGNFGEPCDPFTLGSPDSI